MPERIDGATAAEDKDRTRDSYEEVLATILSYYPETDDVLRQTDVLNLKAGSVSLPIITIGTERVPLLPQKLDANAVRSVQIRVQGIEKRELTETIDRCQGTSELIPCLQETVTRAIAFRLLLDLLYGIPVNSTTANLRNTAERVESSLPDL